MNTLPQIQPYSSTRINSNPSKLATYTKTQTTDDRRATNPKEGKTHMITSLKMQTKITVASNHWSLISLNINELNSPIKNAG